MPRTSKKVDKHSSKSVRLVDMPAEAEQLLLTAIKALDEVGGQVTWNVTRRRARLTVTVGDVEQSPGRPRKPVFLDGVPIGTSIHELAKAFRCTAKTIRNRVAEKPNIHIVDSKVCIKVGR